MAYSELYRSQSQTSTSSISAIDGIGMKINEALIPPPPVKIPAEYHSGNPSEVLFMEYDFSLEERVLKWTQQERENEEATQKAETERLAEKIQTFSQESEPQPAAGNVSTAPAESTWSGQEQAAQTLAPNPSPFINLGSTILTPMPIGSYHKRKESGGKKDITGLFDLKDFESEQDPFESAELKVLNDREELNKMVFDVQPLPTAQPNSIESNVELVASGSEPKVVNQPSPPCTPVNLNDVDYPEVESLDSAQYPLDQSQPSTSVAQYSGTQPQVLLQTNSNQAYYQPPQTIATSQAIPSQSLSRENTFPFNHNMPLPPIPKSQYLVQGGVANNPTFMNANSVAARSTSPSVIGQMGAESVNMSSASVTYKPQLGDKGYVPYQNYYSRHSLTNNNTSNGHLLPFADSSQTQGAHGRETPPLNPLRSVRSTPDISGSEERRLPPLLPSSHTPPPTARSQSPNDISTSSSPTTRHQDWNHYSILPSTPRSSNNTPTSQKTTPNARTKLPNPFDSLSHDAQRYVESVTDMGFPRARVARAVQKLGNDDKQVIDHLCMVNRLSEQGHDEEDAETALHLFENNIEKAEQYLKLLSQFKEIGFMEKNIQEALVSTNLDENKTLDVLTAS